MITYIPYSNKDNENIYFQQLLSYANSYRLGIVSNKLPLISNLAIIENILLPSSFHDNTAMKSAEASIHTELNRFNLGHILYYRKNQLSIFEDFLVKYITAKQYQPDAIVLFSSLRYLYGKDREDFFTFLKDEIAENFVMIEGTDVKTLLQSQLTTKETTFDSWVTQNLKE